MPKKLKKDEQWNLKTSPIFKKWVELKAVGFDRPEVTLAALFYILNQSKDVIQDITRSYNVFLKSGCKKEVELLEKAIADVEKIALEDAGKKGKKGRSRVARSAGKAG